MEAPQQYTQRILGYLEGKKPMEILAATPPQIARLVEGVSRKKLSQRPASHKWSVTEILAHLADTELVCGFRIRLILGASGTPIQASTRTLGQSSPTMRSTIRYSPSKPSASPGSGRCAC
jgi:hypothetical protein